MILETESSLAPSLASVSAYATTSGLNPSALVSSEEGEASREKRRVWSHRIDDLLAIRLLEDDWDGLGAAAPTAALVDSAIDYVKMLRDQKELQPPTRVGAGPMGMVLLEWQVGCIYLEAEVTKPCHAEWMLERPDHPTAHWEDSWLPL